MEHDETISRATAEANEIFQKMQSVVEEQAKEGVTELDVLEVTRAAGLELDDGALRELQVPRVVLVHPFIPWHVWFPWRPFWCWWWRFRYPWYRCCPWWWHRCHWHPW